MSLEGAEGATWSPWCSTMQVAADGSVWEVDSGGQIVHFKVPLIPDVPSDYWASDAIRLCYLAGIVGGYSDGNYHPEYVVTRAQMAVFVSRALARGDKNVPPGPETASFSDVPTDYWAFKYIEYAHQNNIVQGYGNGNYGPEDSLDRSQMAVFLARSMVEPHGDAGLASYVPPATPSFPDVPADFWAFKHIEYIKSQNVTQGYSDGQYHPGDLCTRDQMAVFVMRAFKLPWN